MFGFSVGKRLAKQTRIEPTLQGSPLSSLNSSASLASAQSWNDLFTSPVTSSGMVVTPETAMRNNAVYACVRLLSGTISGLPLIIYKGNPISGNRVAQSNHPYHKILNIEPNKMMTAAVFWKYMVASRLLGGDAYAVIVRQNSGAVTELVPIDPRQVLITRSTQTGLEGRLIYHIQTGHFAGVYDQDDILHIPGEGYNAQTFKGMSVITHAAKQAIGTNAAAEEYVARFFSNGARPDYAISFEGKPDQNSLDLFRQEMDNKHKGVHNAHRPMLLGSGAKILPISLSAQDSQIMELLKMGVIDIARAFGVPPVMIGESEKTSSWGKGIEQLIILYNRLGVSNITIPFHQEINRKLFNGKAFFVEYDLRSLLKGDSASQAAYYRQAIGGSNGPGWMTTNEIRGELGLNRLEGNKYDNPVEWVSGGTPATDEQFQPEEGDDATTSPDI